MMEFIDANELAILRWLHIVAMVYWLGGEWGVFQTSYKVVDPRLSMDERRRHMDTAYKIDILARTGIISLLPLGLHMGHLWGIQPLGGAWLWGMWIVWAAWMWLTWAAFLAKGTPRFKPLSDAEDWTRYLLIPTLILVSGASLLGYGPLSAEDGQRWYSAKMLFYGLALIIGVWLRITMHEWQKLFPLLANGPNAEIEEKMAATMRVARRSAYVYWVLILSTAFFGAVKPF